MEPNVDYKFIGNREVLIWRGKLNAQCTKDDRDVWCGPAVFGTGIPTVWYVGPAVPEGNVWHVQSFAAQNETWGPTYELALVALIPSVTGDLRFIDIHAERDLQRHQGVTAPHTFLLGPGASLAVWFQGGKKPGLPWEKHFLEVSYLALEYASSRQQGWVVFEDEDETDE